jgi:regulator of replication initiation timing
MTLSQITETLKHLNIHPNEIADEQLAEAFRILLQLIEELYEENEKLKVENQKLRDAINLLKGEQTKPNQTSSPQGRDRTKTSPQKKKEKHKTPQKRKNQKRRSIR